MTGSWRSCEGALCPRVDHAGGRSGARRASGVATRHNRGGQKDFGFARDPLCYSRHNREHEPRDATRSTAGIGVSQLTAVKVLVVLGWEEWHMRVTKGGLS